ncbi:hypothetical protein ES705_49815 [subsurface metagenome]
MVSLIVFQHQLSLILVVGQTLPIVTQAIPGVGFRRPVLAAEILYHQTIFVHYSQIETLDSL